jgi:iron complex outermembrane receptor protein
MGQRVSALGLCLGVLIIAATASERVAAQEPQAAEPAAPADGAVELPKLTVETQAKKPTKKSAQKKAPAASAPAPVAQSNQGDAASKPETGTGPLQNGYVASQTTTGSKTDTPLREIPQSVSVVGKEQIRDQGAQSLQEALRYVPGVVADGYGLDSRSDGVLIRGTEAAEYLDGLRRTFNYYTYNYRVDPYFMERIEVLRGPASVLYGQAPVGGIINSVSKRPQEEQQGEVTAQYGTFDFKQVRADFTGPLTTDGKWLYRVTGLARDADTQVDYVEDDRYAVAPSITYKPVPGTSITLLGHFQKNESGSTLQFYPHAGTVFPNVNGNRIPSDRFAGEPDQDKYNTDVASGTLLVEHKLNDVFKIKHASRYADIQNEYVSHFPGGYFDANQTQIFRYKYLSDTDTNIFTTDTNLEAKFETGALRHKVLGGVDYSDFQAVQGSGFGLDVTPFDVYNPVHGRPTQYSTNLCDGTPSTSSVVPLCPGSEQTVTQTGIYLQDQLRLGDWIAVLGGRYDWIENGTEGSETQKDEAATYRAGLMYEFDFGLTPYVSYAQSFVPVVGVSRLGGTFDPQEGEMVEVGFKYQPPGSSFVINSAVYEIDESNRLSSDPVNLNFSVQGGAVNIRGFEFEATGDVTANLKAIATYSYTDAEYVSGDQAGFQVESIPKHLASFWAIYTFDSGALDGWSFGGGVRYIGASLDGVDTVETPAVTLFDAMIAYETPEWRWSINASNLEDERYMSTCLGYGRGDCFEGARRTIITGLTYKF